MKADSHHHTVFSIGLTIDSQVKHGKCGSVLPPEDLRNDHDGLLDFMYSVLTRNASRRVLRRETALPVAHGNIDDVAAPE